MKEFIEKLISRLKQKHIPYLGMDNSVPYGTEMVKLFDVIKIVNQLAEEYKQQFPNDLMIVSSLPSLYSLQDFEEEAIQRVVGNANIPEMDINELFEKDKQNDGWIPCSERLPEGNENVLCYAKSTARGGDTWFVGSCDNGFWFLQTAIGTLSYPTQYEVVAWQPLPAPYQPKGE